MVKSDILEYVATADTDTLNDLIDLIKIRKEHLAMRVRSGLCVGQTVTFVARRDNWRGTIQKINRKKVKVLARNVSRGDNSPTVTWNVPISMLEVE